MRDELIESIKDILEVDQINMEDELESFEMWDSLAKLSLVTSIDEIFKKSINEEVVDEFKIVSDIFEYLQI
jgi:acyl carrier protein